ncbi:MAG: TetR/AcrR family transcriptional regulator [Tateyamaria sp.]|uniref:TetR/AcrR family transcriptional regulator n=1 Tax=Tateyamaria sp. TaxID=1929288 RepID=UPI00327FF129
MPKDRNEQILDFAEREIRKNGFDGVSFRDIADAIGVKSASVHYHFPTKAHLGAEVTRRYANRFIEALGSASDPSETSSDRMRRLADGYIEAYKQDTSTCLCAVLGSVVNHLPDETSKEVRAYYVQLQDWVRASLAQSDTTLTPNVVIGAFQGAMVLALSTNDVAPLIEANNHIVSLA